MNNAKKTFISGLNHDASFFAHTKEDNLDALNARVISSADGKSGSLSNIDGNRKISNSLIEKDAQVVGSFEDPLTNDVYFFTVSSASSNPSKIFVYDNSANAIYLVLSDADLEIGETLGFSKTKPITGINFIDGLLYWTGADGREPCRVNVDRGIKLHHNSYSTTESAYETPIKKSIITIIRKPPMLPPTILAEVDSNRDTSFLKSQAHTFAFRYKYKDGETSVFSPTSNYYPHQDMDNANHKLTRRIKVTFPAEYVEQDVKKIQFAVKFDNDTSYFIIKEFDDFTSHNTDINAGSIYYNYYNDTLGNSVDDSNSVKLYDTVPQEAESLTIARNRLFLGNYKTGLENPSEITSSKFGVDIITSEIPDQTTLLDSDRTDGGILGFSSASAYQLGLAFYDFAGRTAGVLTSDDMTIVTPERAMIMTTYTDRLEWELKSGSNTLIPTWATHYSILRTKNLTKDFTLGNLINKIRYYKYASDKSFTVNVEKLDDNNDPTGKFEDNELVSFSGEFEGIAIGLGDLTTYKLGYSYQAGDRIKIITPTDVFDFGIVGTSGRYVLVNLVNLNDSAYLGTASLVSLDNALVYEIYSPHKKTANEFFYETDNRYLITNPGESNRGFSVTEGSIQGDIYLKKRKADTSDEETFSIDHTDDNTNSHENPIVGATDYIEFPVFYGSTLNDLSVTDYTSYTGTKDERFLIEIDATGTPDTFKWKRNDQDASYTTGVSITGSAQTLTDGVSIQFAATTGHGVGDYWVVSAKSQYGHNQDQNLNDEGRTAYAFLEGPPNDFIPEGSEVKFTIKETGKARTTKDIVFSPDEITTNYANLEELIENVDPGLSKFGIFADSFSRKILFRRGKLTQDGNSGKSQIKILGNDSDNVTVTSPSLTDGTKISIIVPSYSRQETTLGVEIGTRSFIRGTISVNYPNEYGYNTEAMNPSDDYFLNWTQITGRPNIVLENPKEIKKVTGISFSETKIPGSNINGLSKFSALDETELDEVTGPLRKLVLTTKTQSTGTVLLGLSENETTSIYLGEQQLEGSSSGSQFLAVTKGVIGTKNTLKGSYGCINPESVATSEGNAFWFDAKNSTVLRYSTEGVSSIGDVNMRSFFKKKGPLAISGDKVYGTYDIYNDEYILTLPKSGEVSVTLQQEAEFDDDPIIVGQKDASNLLNSWATVQIGSPWNITEIVDFTNGVGTLTFNNEYRFRFDSPVVSDPTGTNISVANSSSPDDAFITESESGYTYHKPGTGSLTISNVQDNVGGITIDLIRNDGNLTGTVIFKNWTQYTISNAGPYDTPLRIDSATQTTTSIEQKNSVTVTNGSATVACTSNVPWKFSDGLYYVDQDSTSQYTAIPVANRSSNATAIGNIGYQAGTSFNVTVIGISDQVDVIQLNTRPLLFASVLTNDGTSINQSSFTMNGTFSGLGDGTFTEKGFVYSTVVNVPEIGDDDVTKQVVSGSSTGSFSHVFAVGTFNSSTDVYYRAFVTTNVGTVYGAVETITTLDPSINAPSVTTNAASSITSTGAQLNGVVTANGGGTITEKGFVFSLTSTNNNPEINGTGVTKVNLGSSVILNSVFSTTLSNLSSNSGYTFKAYAINSGGTGYGAATTFTTSSVSATLGNFRNLTSSVSANGGTVQLEFVKSGSGVLSGTATVEVSDGLSVLADAETEYNISIGSSQTSQTVNFTIPSYDAPVNPARNLSFSITELVGISLSSGSLPKTASATTSQNGNGNIG